MPRPTAATVIQRPDLGVLAYETMFAPGDYIADQIFPVFPTDLATGDYPIIPIESFLKNKDTRRAPRSAYARDDYEFTTGTFACRDHGREEPLDDVEAAMYRRFFDGEVVAVNRGVHKMRQAREVRVAAQVFNTANITLTAAAAAAWDVAATATPKADVDDAIEALRLNRGIMPNTVVLAYDVFKNVLRCKELKEYLQYTSPHLIETEQAQRDMLAKYFGVQQVLVAKAIYDTAAKGKAASLGNIWSHDYVGVFRLAQQVQDLQEPCLGRTFLWTEDSPELLVTEQYREENKRSWIYRVRNNLDERFVFTGAGYLISGVTT
ncbi:MAG: major capsid protein [Deltaproteobacteria bacterium]|nr:major capsid protein [Deltaproteobacteria bacterium]